MRDPKSQIEILNKAPLKWPRGDFKFEFGDVHFEITRDRGYRDKATYAVFFSLSSMKFGLFLDAVGRIHGSLSSCPRLRHVARPINSNEPGGLGQSWWIVLKPDWKGPLDESQVVDRQDYQPGTRLVRLGCSILLEQNFARCTLDIVNMLETKDGLLRSHMRDGFITINTGAFDSFYGFVFASHQAGKSAEECFSLIPNSGVALQYPESFNAGGIARKDIQALYGLLGTHVN